MIRRAVLEDFEDIHLLITILEEKKYDINKMYKIYEKHVHSENHEYYVYLHDNKIVGMISLLIKDTLHHSSLTGEIIELCILPEYRNSRIGASLLKFIESRAVELCLSELELSSNVKRKDAHRFYERHLYNKDHFNFTKPIHH